MKNQALCELLEALKDEVDGWELEGDPADPALIRHGLYLTAMDILLAEMFEPGGYESYCKLPDRIKLPEDDYYDFRRALNIYVEWFKSLNLKRLTREQADATPIETNETIREIGILGEVIFGEVQATIPPRR